ncbi:MAG TPA: N-acetylmuramoyl-L-alanine amidase [Streptosporangiaceae bacterium]
MTGKLEIGADGRVTGPLTITYNTPFPTGNGSWGSGAMMGVVMHTMVGNLPGTVEIFNNPSYAVSSHFGIAQDGSVWQFGPIGHGWIAWAQVAGNEAWYSIEHADDGNTANPLTDAQLTASAQLVEVLSRFAGFPLQVTNSVEVEGYGTHVMGGGAWGGHTCPGPGPRAGQRREIIRRAEAIRAGQVTWTSDGKLSLNDLAAHLHTEASSILRMTAIHDGAFGGEAASYINGVFAGTTSAEAALPTGLMLWVPAS